MLTLSKSRKIVDGAIQRARQLNAKISVAVCGRGGRLIAFSRMDGCAGWDVDRSSMGKATAAAIIGCPSDQLCDRYASGLRIPSYANVVPPQGQRGGLPIVEEGVIEGGCGVSGAATAEESEECARAGIAVLNFASTDLSTGLQAARLAETAGDVATADLATQRVDAARKGGMDAGKSAALNLSAAVRQRHVLSYH
jgi:glc operon protein GlcG